MNRKTKRPLPPEFRLECAQLMVHTGHSCQQTCRLWGLTSPNISWRFSVCEMPDEHHRAFCISKPGVVAHGYKLPRTLWAFPGPALGPQDARVKTHFSGSRLFAQPVSSGSSHNHQSLNRLFRSSHGLTDKELSSIATTQLESNARLSSTPCRAKISLWRYCSGQQKLATALEFFQYRFSDSFGGNPPLYSCGLSAL